MNYIAEYFAQIESGAVVVSSKVKRQYQKLVADCAALTYGYHFDEKRASRPIEFIERFCKHSKGEYAGKPFTLELWQKAFLQALFGFVDDDGNRRYREAMLYVSRKNGKSSLLAALALYCLVADGEAGAEIYSCATKLSQARLVFDEALNMVKQSPELKQCLKKRKTDLYFPLTFSKFQPLGRNSDTLDGLNSSTVIIDELHAIRDRRQYEVMKQSQSARLNPLLISITTAGTLRESIFDDMYSYASAVCCGTVEDIGFLPILYELDSRAEWQNPAMWQKSNPALGTVKKFEDLQAKVKRAAQSPQDLAGLLTKDFNVIENQARAWLTFEDLNNTATFDLEQFRGCYAIGGADLSRTLDLTCATILILGADEVRYVKQMYWLPSTGFTARVEADKVPYDKWYRQGHLRLSTGRTIAYSGITDWFNEIIDKYEITLLEVGYDSWSARYWCDEMQSYGFKLRPVIQGAKTLSLPMQQLQADLQSKRVNYGNNPILKWCLSNTGVQVDRNENICPVKAHGNKYKIDGTASLLDAYCVLLERYSEILSLATGD